MTEQLKKIWDSLENMSEAMVKMQGVIGDLVRSNLELRRRVDELEKRSSSEG
jgi:hypothetical protein